MRMNKKNRLALVAASLLGFACIMSPGGNLNAQEATSSSSACIKCHTDFEAMDRYGAAAASSASAIAG